MGQKGLGIGPSHGKHRFQMTSPALNCSTEAASFLRSNRKCWCILTTFTDTICRLLPFNSISTCNYSPTNIQSQGIIKIISIGHLETINMFPPNVAVWHMALVEGSENHQRQFKGLKSMWKLVKICFSDLSNSCWDDSVGTTVDGRLIIISLQ